MNREPASRLSRDQYYMGIALAVRKRANCLGSRVGAVLVRDDRVIATGYNGTPSDMPNCDEGGCDRCSRREQYGSGQAYDVCICVHAEQNALLTAARFGIPVEGATAYTTMRPCFGCTKELLQAGVRRVYFLRDWTPREEVRNEYERLQLRFPEGIRKLDVSDPDDAWAHPAATLQQLDTGHPVPGTENGSVPDGHYSAGFNNPAE